MLVVAEGLLVAALAGAQRGISLCQSLLRAQLGQRVNVMILEKALTLDLTHFENSDFYDKLTRARREASSRPLSLVMRTFGLAQNAVSLVSYGSAADRVLAVGGGGADRRRACPRFSPRRNFPAMRSGCSCGARRKRACSCIWKPCWRAKITSRKSSCSASVRCSWSAIAHIFRKLYKEDRDLTVRRDTWGFFLGLIAHRDAVRRVRVDRTLGHRRAHHARPDDDVPDAVSTGSVRGVGDPVGGRRDVRRQPVSVDVVRISRNTGRPGQRRRWSVARDQTTAFASRTSTFPYPDAEQPTLVDINLHIRPGESLALVGENGSGKTTLIKLLTRLYQPTHGRILLDGQDLREWDEAALRDRIGVIFQDFTRYQLLLGENIGAGDVQHFERRDALARGRRERHGHADRRDAAARAISTPLGKWFNDGRELSGGQWQKVALSRAFMRSRADILVLDEPTAAMDAGAEATIFEHFRALTQGRIAILISHRFSTVRMADQIVVLQDGRIIERGSHEELMQVNGHYAHLFSLQAKGYR